MEQKKLTQGDLLRSGLFTSLPDGQWVFDHEHLVTEETALRLLELLNEQELVEQELAERAEYFSVPSM